MLITAVRWLAYNLAPAFCPDCAGLLTFVARRTAREVGAWLPRGDSRHDQRSDWLCCEDCDYAAALDLLDESKAS